MNAVSHREDFLQYARSKAFLHNSKEYFRSNSMGSLSQCDTNKTPLPPYDCHLKALPRILTEFLAKTYTRKGSLEVERRSQKINRASSLIRQITPIVLATSICEETYESQTHFEDEGEQQEEQLKQAKKGENNYEYSQVYCSNFDNLKRKHNSWHKNELFSERNISRWVSRQDSSFLEQSSFLEKDMIIPPIQPIKQQQQLTRSRSIQESFSQLTIQQYQQNLQQIQQNNLLVPINSNRKLNNLNKDNSNNSRIRDKRNVTLHNSSINVNNPTNNNLLDSHQQAKPQINKLGKVQVLYSYNHAKSSSVLSPSIDLSSFLTKRKKTTTTASKELDDLKTLSNPINDADNLSLVSQSTARGVPSSQRTSITSQHQAPSTLLGNVQSSINSYQRKRKISETRSSVSSIHQITHIPVIASQTSHSNQQLISNIEGTSRDKINLSQVLVTDASSSGSPSPRKRFLSQQVKKSLSPKKIRSKKTVECCDEIIDFIPQMRDDLERKIRESQECIVMIEQKLMLSISEFLFMLTQFWKFCAENPNNAETGFAIFKLNIEYIYMIETNLKLSLFEIPLPDTKKQLFLESFTRHSRKLMIPLNLVEHIGGEIHAGKILTNFFQHLKEDIAIGNFFIKILDGIDIPHACKLFYSLLKGEYSEIESILPIARNVLSLSSEEFLQMKLRFSEVLLQETLLSLEDKMIVLERFEKLRTYILQDTFLVNLLHSGDELQAVLHSNRELLSLIKEHDRAFVKALADSTLQALFGRTTLIEFKNHLSAMFLLKNSTSNNANCSNNAADHDRNDHLYTIVSLLESSVVPFVQQRIISKHQAFNTAQHAKLKFEFLKEDIAKKYSQAVQNSGKPIALALRTWAIENFRKYLKHIEVTEIENSRLEFMTAFLRLYFYRNADVFSYFDIPIAAKHFAFNDTALEFWMIGLKEVLGDPELKLDLKLSEIEIIILNISNILTYCFKTGSAQRDSSPLSPLTQKLPQIITKKNTIPNEQDSQLKSSTMDRSPSPSRKLLIFQQKDGSISPSRDRAQTILPRNTNTLLKQASIAALKS